MVLSGDTKGELTKIIENAEFRQQAILDMITTAKENHFEGILLDFEGLGLTTDKTLTRSAFTAFVKELDTAANKEGLKLSLALHPLNSSYQGYDYKALGDIADELIIMAYDYGTKGTPEPVNKINEAILLALEQTDKDNLILGINLYSENADSVSTVIGLAKRYDLKGIALWRLGLISSDEWSSMQQSVEFRQ
ncbi:Spore germination protein YaaH [compost metagenome]